ncbi:MqnA/MqnD/SBP family protein [Hydrogenimonas sp.]
MVFGKIEYLNLLPFHQFLKRYFRHGAEKAAWRKKGGHPAAVNEALRRGRIDAAVISSVASRRWRCADMGIVADGAVWSVLALPGENRPDEESATSNALAGVLGIEGRLLIGDKALRHYFEKGEGIDLAAEWKARTGLPFVFARLCGRGRHARRIGRIGRLFLKAPVQVPYRDRARAAEKLGITVSQLDSYLARIGYRLGWRERRALARFLKAAGRKG